MPQSRHRKTNKAKKRPKAPYQGAKPKPAAAGGSGSNTARTIAIVIVLALTLTAVAYLIVNRNPKTGPETTTASGLKYIDEVAGTGATPQPGQTVAVKYTGTLVNGKKFDSSYDHPGQAPLEFKLGTKDIIQGWNEGIGSMKVGGKRKLTIPPALAYKQFGKPPQIPPNSTLLFDVELVSVK